MKNISTHCYKAVKACRIYTPLACKENGTTLSSVCLDLAWIVYTETTARRRSICGVPVRSPIKWYCDSIGHLYGSIRVDFIVDITAPHNASPGSPPSRHSAWKLCDWSCAQRHYGLHDRFWILQALHRSPHPPTHPRIEAEKGLPWELLVHISRCSLQRQRSVSQTLY